MLAIEVELLTGRYAATAHDDRRRAEWPPHPARFHSALVAALHDREPVEDAERVALLWLERQRPPALDVDLEVDERVGRREVHDVFVPVNDLSVAGDVWPLVSALAEVEAALGAAEADSKTEASNVKALTRAVAAAKKKLAKLLSDAVRRSDEPSASDVRKAAALMPDQRTRQVRTFPVAVPGRTTFSFVWDSKPSEGVRAAIEALCDRVTRLGHSSSLVRCALVERPVQPTLVPARDGEWVLRVVGEGQLVRLEAEHARHRAVESRVLPARPHRYGRAVPSAALDIPSSIFGDDWIVYERREGARPLSSRGTDVAYALRAALLDGSGEGGPIPLALSGRRADGGPSEEAHLAFVACPFVGRAHADGSVQGCAIVLPRNLSDADRRGLHRRIAMWEKRTARDGLVELTSDGLPPLRCARVLISEKDALSPARWCRPSARFVTATPIALDRHPGNLRSNSSGTAHRASVEAQRTIAEACERIGLPRPVSVEISLAPMLPGAQPVHAFRPWPDRPGRVARARVHADIRFDRPVRGPILLGAGRYFGLGLCLPVAGRGDR